MGRLTLSGIQTYYKALVIMTVLYFCYITVEKGRTNHSVNGAETTG